MFDNMRIFCLYADTSKHAAGSTRYQIQNEQPRLIVYASYRMPIAVQNYSVTKLELCRLVINVVSFIIY